ncbi:hypothetical protein [Halorubrum salinum]|uniref:hypothetical protein n=1 Tax=Halorubrum salinum TaxID=767517 RepID=UPI00211269A7|nr:hypothetical protein [Halorubrum salinum]
MSGSDGGGGITGWADLSPPPIIEQLIDNPQTVILGAVLSGIVEAVFGVVSQLIDIVLLVFGGTRPGQFNAPGETIGLADVPVAIAEGIGGAGESLGTTILVTIRGFNAGVFEAAGALGPFAPLVVVTVIVVEVVVAVWLLQRLVYLLADWLQLGGLTE